MDTLSPLQATKPAPNMPANTGRRRDELSRFVHNTWYVAMFSSDLEPGQMDAPDDPERADPVLSERRWRRGCDDRPLFTPFRAASDGKIAAGRQGSMHLHGLEFGADGHCVKNPHGKGVIPPPLHLRSFPVVERHTLIWIWMGDKKADPATIPDYSCLDNRPALHVTRPGYLNVAAHYELVVDNLLDLSHISYVHVEIEGNADTANADIGVDQKGDVVAVSRFSKNAETPGILKMMSSGRLRVRRSVEDDFLEILLSNMILEFGASKPGEPKEKGTGYFAIHLLTPETERSTHYHYTAARCNVLTDDEQNTKIRLKRSTRCGPSPLPNMDVPVIEAQQICMDQPDQPLRPALLSIDAGPIAYRKVLDRLLSEES